MISLRKKSVSYPLFVCLFVCFLLINCLHALPCLESLFTMNAFTSLPKSSIIILLFTLLFTSLPDTLHPDVYTPGDTSNANNFASSIVCADAQTLLSYMTTSVWSCHYPCILPSENAETCNENFSTAQDVIYTTLFSSVKTLPNLFDTQYSIAAMRG